LGLNGNFYVYKLQVNLNSVGVLKSGNKTKKF